MSKLFDLMMPRKVGREPAPVNDLVNVKLECDHINYVQSATVYSIKINLGRQVIVQDSLNEMSDGVVLDEALKSVRRELIETVYGEFRPDLEELLRMIMEGKNRAAMKKLSEVREKMFS